MESKFSSSIGGGNSQDYGQIEFSLDSLPKTKGKYQAAEPSFFWKKAGEIGGVVGNGIASGLLKTGAIDWYVGKFKFDENQVVNEQLEIMNTQLKDPHFIEFYQFISSVLITKI
jgi:hypothetical protein